MENKRIQVLLVDDSASVRQTMKALLNESPDIEVMDAVGDPFQAAERIAQRVPDVIILDIEMPRMDGLSFLKQIMTQHPIPTIICSSLAVEGSDSIHKALAFGAIDVITKPKLATKQFLEESKTLLQDAVRGASQARLSVQTRRVLPATSPKLTADSVIPQTRPRTLTETTDKVVVVGASTGGTEALREFLEGFPEDAPGIVIVQHMPENFTKSFAQRLDSLCRLRVKEASHGDAVLRGQALVAPGNRHCLLKRSGAQYYVEIKDGPLVTRHRPSVNVLFRSTAQNAGRNALGVILTGMGDDGATGMKEMKDAGSATIAQDEASCVVYGMPKEAVKLGAVDRILPLSQISGAVYQWSKG